MQRRLVPPTQHLEWERFDQTTLKEVRNSFATFFEQNVAYEAKVIELWRLYAEPRGILLS